MFGYSREALVDAITGNRAYDYAIVFSLACDPGNRVHDLSGEFVLDDGESVEDAPEAIIDQYLAEEGIEGAYPVKVLSFDYKPSGLS